MIFFINIGLNICNTIPVNNIVNYRDFLPELCAVSLFLKPVNYANEITTIVQSLKLLKVVE